MKKTIHILLAGLAGGLGAFLLRSPLSFAGAADHDFEKSSGYPKAEKTTGEKREADGGKRGSCSAQPTGLTSFANGEAFDFPSMVTFLTSPECTQNARQLSRGLLGSVKFRDSGPFRLDHYAKRILSSDPSAPERVEYELSNRVPTLLRQYPLTSAEMLPLIGQLSLLSHPAARSSMANLIAQELYNAAGDDVRGVVGPQRMAGKDLAKKLLTMGAVEPFIQADMGLYVEGLATLVQSDSLVKYFSSLASAVAAEKKLAMVFNTTANGLSHGIQGGAKVYSKEEKGQMLAALFSAIRSSAGLGSQVEVGSAELNEAMEALLAGEPLSATAIRGLWRDAIGVLAKTQTQPALANAVALALTPEYIYLPKPELEALFQAAHHYPDIAVAVQYRFLTAWQSIWEGLHSGRVQATAFNRIKAERLEPMVQNILDLEPKELQAAWLREVVRRNLISDATIELRFPKAVSALVLDREKTIRGLASDDSFDATVRSLGKSLHTLHLLGHIYIPALMNWAARVGAENEKASDLTEEPLSTK